VSDVIDWAALRPLAFSVAYGMLGSVTEAEDVAQEALLRMHRHAEPIESPAAFAVTTTTRLAIDQLRSARTRRETYVGAWLPEPLLAPVSTDPPAEHAELTDRLSTAFLLMLERLAPVERAVLLLREAFDYDYDRIAQIVERSPTNCRQILARAKAHLHEPTTRFAASSEHGDELVRRFFAASTSGDLLGLEQLLIEDIKLIGDGGGVVPALASPAVGRSRVARFVLGLLRQARTLGVTLELVRINGQLGILGRDPSGVAVATMSFGIGPDGIDAVYNVVNPAKLRHIPPQSQEPRERA
jgi:RNA polymerase sigma factor (sigma-70 family)